MAYCHWRCQQVRVLVEVVDKWPQKFHGVFSSTALLDYRSRISSRLGEGYVWQEVKASRHGNCGCCQRFFKGVSPGVLILKLRFEATSSWVRGQGLVSLFILMLELEKDEVTLRAPDN